MRSLSFSKRFYCFLFSILFSLSLIGWLSFSSYLHTALSEDIKFGRICIGSGKLQYKSFGYDDIDPEKNTVLVHFMKDTSLQSSGLSTPQEQQRSTQSLSGKKDAHEASDDVNSDVTFVEPVPTIDEKTNEDDSRPATPPPLDDTYFAQGKSFASNVFNESRAAQERLRSGDFKVDDVAYAMTAYGIDLFSLLGDSLDDITFGAFSQVMEGLDDIADGSRTFVRRGLRNLTEN